MHGFAEYTSHYYQVPHRGEDDLPSTIRGKATWKTYTNPRLNTYSVMFKKIPYNVEFINFQWFYIHYAPSEEHPELYQVNPAVDWIAKPLDFGLGIVS